MMHLVIVPTQSSRDETTELEQKITNCGPNSHATFSKHSLLPPSHPGAGHSTVRQTPASVPRQSMNHPSTSHLLRRTITNTTGQTPRTEGK